MKNIITLAIAVLFTGSIAFADTGKFPDISHQDLKAAIESGSVVLLDVNAERVYRDSHIPGAIHFPAVSQDLAKALPKDKDALIVAYCGNKHCGAYKRAAEAAAALGYRNVKYYSGGIQGWKDAGENVDRSG